MENRQYNKNLLFLIDCLNNDKRGAILEGSSRSGKTFSSIDFIMGLCSNYESPLTINIVKETYNSFKTTLYDDFSRRLDDYGLDNPFERSKEIHTFKIFNHKINFLGADVPSKFHGASADFYWFNEMLDIPKSIFDQCEMRTRIMFWGDYNPSVSLHYIYDNIIPRDDVGFLKTTFKDNPYISKHEKNKILSYEPNDHNRKQGTADDYMWKVYGLGERMSRTGLVFPNVTWIDKFPDDVDQIRYGWDIGYTVDPSALVRGAVNGNDLYLELLIYEPTENASVAAPLIKAAVPDINYLVSDSADPGFIVDLCLLGVPTTGIKKYPGSIKHGISVLKSYNIHIVKNHNAQKEQENYAYREINGISLEEPIDKFNHFWDAARYLAMFWFRKMQ